MPSLNYTIGHSNHTFQTLLDTRAIQKVVDVRSTPFSKYLPHFNHDSLHSSLKSNGIAYFRMGDTLGGRPKDPSLYDEQSRVSYATVRRTSAFQDALHRLLDLSDNTPTALLCAEGAPLTCRRTLMVAAEIETQGHNVLHIDSAGAATPHSDLIDHLVETMPPLPLEANPTNPRERAIALQASKHAYLRPR